MGKQKQTTLELLHSKADGVINFIVSSIENLKEINKSIVDEQEKNSVEILKLQSTNNSLSDLKNSNDKVINNFEKLLQ
jgi:flagellar biosynthesis/type III secretory pathway M-ring protein FliF/YscJ